MRSLKTVRGSDDASRVLPTRSTSRTEIRRVAGTRRWALSGGVKVTEDPPWQERTKSRARRSCRTSLDTQIMFILPQNGPSCPESRIKTDLGLFRLAVIAGVSHEIRDE